MPSATRERGVGWGRRAAGAVLASLLVLAPLSGATDFTKYHTYDELSAALKAVVSAHPDLAKLTAIGQDPPGAIALGRRDRESRRDPGRASGRGCSSRRTSRAITSSAASWRSPSSSTSLNGYATDADVKQRLDSHVIYIVPRVNPDGAEQMFAPVKTGGTRQPRRRSTGTTTAASTRTGPRT